VGLLFISFSFAQTTRNVPSQYATIQAGLNAAQSGDIVLVQSGTYIENLFWPSRNGISLIGIDSTNTIIDGSQVMSVITIYGNNIIDSTTVISGFRIKNGSGVQKGGGIFCKDASPVLKNLSVNNNSATLDGGGLYIENGSCTILNCSIWSNSVSQSSSYGGGLYITGKQCTFNNVYIISNTAPLGSTGGIYCGSGINMKNCKISFNTANTNGGAYIANNIALTNTEISNNFCNGNFGTGGALTLIYASGIIENSLISNNTAYYNVGGGAYLMDGTLLFHNVKFLNNVSAGGGGFYQRATGSSNNLTFDSCEFSNNYAILNGPGGGFLTEYSVMNITNSNFKNNHGRDGAGIYADGNSILNLTNVKFIGNIASQMGGGIYGYLNFYGYSIWNNVSFIKNSAVDGGAANISNALKIQHSFFENNNASGNGGGIFFNGGSKEIIYTDFSGNSSSNGGAIYQSYPSIILKYSSFSNNSSSSKGGSIYYNNFGSYNSNPDTLAFCSFTNNKKGLYNADNSNLIPLLNNYWGSATGPFHLSQNPSGLGDSVNFFTNIIPFLTSPDTNAPPLPVQNVIVSSETNNSISLNWSPSILTNLAGYKVYWDSDSSGYPYANSIDVGNQAFYTLNNLVFGKKYYIAVTSYDKSGNESWYSVEADTTQSIPLPVELTTFQVTCNNGIVYLKWKTASEKNTSGFEAQRSSTNEVWNKVAFIKGNGNSNSPKEYSFFESHLNSGKYKYRLKLIDNDGSFKYSSIVETLVGVPSEYNLSQNFPNPFNPSTVINYNIPQESKVCIKFYNFLGQCVREINEENKHPGYYDFKFNSSGLSSGVYFYSIQANSTDGKQSYKATKKMILIK
jgi:hypothetical protein